VVRFIRWKTKSAIALGEKYKATFKHPNAEIRKSILYHLNFPEQLGLITEIL